MAPTPPNARRAPAEPWRPSITRASWGPRHGPHTPQRSSRPGGAVALLDHACVVGAPTWPPHPPTLVAPRRSRGAPRSRVRRGGPHMGPPPPHPPPAPAGPRGPPAPRAPWGPPARPPPPPPPPRPPA